MTFCCSRFGSIRSYLERRFSAFVFAQPRAAFHIGAALQEQFRNGELALNGRVRERRPVLRLGVRVGAGMVLGAGDGRRLGVHVGSGVEQHFGERFVTAYRGQHERSQAVLAHRIDLFTKTWRVSWELQCETVASSGPWSMVAVEERAESSRFVPS